MDYEAQWRDHPGTVYSASFRLDGPWVDTARNRSSFVVLDDQGQEVAAAGIDPPWVDDIPGTESQALLQAALRAEPGCMPKVDCRAAVAAVHNRMTWASSDRRVHARIHRLVIQALDGVPPDRVVRMPPLTSPEEVGVRTLSNGEPLTEVDRLGNTRADFLGKAAVLERSALRSVGPRSNSCTSPSSIWDDGLALRL